MVSAFIILDFMPVDDRGIAAVMVHGNGVLIILKDEAGLPFSAAGEFCHMAACIHAAAHFFVGPHSAVIQNKVEIAISLAAIII